ncbi:DNA ligase D [Edaphobacter acidisoli]|uniref:DNA ligase D n=1 Tax=Edaphobacter acidisoli TaxID=2040573 RepID=UPI00295BA18D|nr:DNA ligase D [Edaphobacter acidisoli]
MARYRAMRDFQITAEPKGRAPSKSSGQGLPFCVQKHAASHLHYDFRLGWNGVLKSWACAKGPSYFPGDKRLAVQVEDHPMEYGGFEGIIPAGQYGGGTVMIWDQGTWEPQPGHTDVDAGLRDGSLKFVLHGTKLQGKWALIRMKGKAAQEKKPNWLLIKEHDAFERGKDDSPITETEPDSVVTGRSIEQIARSEDHVWNSRDTGQEKAWFRKNASDEPSGTNALKSWTARLKKMPAEKQPRFVKPQLAAPAAKPPSGSGWLHELKLDGYRIQARKDGSRVQMFTRTGLDWTDRFSAIANEVAALGVGKITLDGEVVVLAPDGSTSFGDLQASFQPGSKHQQTYFCFDVLHVDGRNVRDTPLTERKELLSDLMETADSDLLQVSGHVEADGLKVFHKACELHAEGIVSKRANAHYLPGQNGEWLKVKCLLEQEFVIGGYVLLSNGTPGVGALLLGYYSGGKLSYAGRTGTGFNEKMRKLLREKLEALKRSSTSFASVDAEARRGAIWVKPELVAQVRFTAWTADNLVRQAVFLGLREDKAAKDVMREEEPAPPQTPAAAAGPGLKHAPVRLTHPAKVLDTSSGMTKQVLADYYWTIAERMLPYIAGRPLSLLRCPDGSARPCFFQKHVIGSLPRGVNTVEISHKTGAPEAYMTVASAEGLAGLAQLGVVEVHPWNSQNDDLERPNRMIFDLDPDETLAWPILASAAIDVRMRLKKIGLESFLKTSGGKGLHIVVPILPKFEWPAVKDFTRRFALDMEKANPKLYLTKMTKAARKGKIYIDYLRNEREATAVATYSPRARPGVPVSMPLHWKELEFGAMPIFRVTEFIQWQSRLVDDPWKQLDKINQQIPSRLIVN